MNSPPQRHNSRRRVHSPRPCRPPIPHRPLHRRASLLKTNRQPSRRRQPAPILQLMFSKPMVLQKQRSAAIACAAKPNDRSRTPSARQPRAVARLHVEHAPSAVQICSLSWPPTTTRNICFNSKRFGGLQALQEFILVNPENKTSHVETYQRHE